jgi:hypothetical protein
MLAVLYVLGTLSLLFTAVIWSKYGFLNIAIKFWYSIMALAMAFATMGQLGFIVQL